MSQPQKHAALIKAWADGAEIQWRTQSTESWKDSRGIICWYENYEYRIKPEPKPDEVRYVFTGRSGSDCFHTTGCYGKKVEIPYFDSYLTYKVNGCMKLTFDGETGKLKSAEVIK